MKDKFPYLGKDVLITQDMCDLNEHMNVIYYAKIFEDEFQLSHLGPKWLEVDLRSIDKLILSTKHYWQFAAEDLHFRIEDDL